MQSESTCLNKIEYLERELHTLRAEREENMERPLALYNSKCPCQTGRSLKVVLVRVLNRHAPNP